MRAVGLTPAVCARPLYDRAVFGTRWSGAASARLRAGWVPAALVAFLVGRLLTLAAAAVAVALARGGHLGTNPAFGSTIDLSDVFTRWDADWFRSIASDGYPTDANTGAQSALAFMPGWPIVLAGIGAIGVDQTAGGIVVSLALSLGAVLLLGTLTARSFDDRIARRSAVLLALAPAGVVFSMPYSESLTLAALLGAMLAVARGWLLPAFFLAATASLARFPAVIIAVPFAIEALRARRVGAAAAGTFGAITGVVAHFGYLWAHTGDPLAYFDAQKAWDRATPGLGGLWTALRDGVSEALSDPTSSQAVALVLLAASLVAVVWASAERRLPWHWTLYAAIIVLLPISTGILTSVPRLYLIAIPVLWALALVASRNWFRVIVAGSTLLMVVGTVTILRFNP